MLRTVAQVRYMSHTPVPRWKKPRARSPALRDHAGALLRRGLGKVAIRYRNRVPIRFWSAGRRREQAGEEVTDIDARQPDEQPGDRGVVSEEEHHDPKRRDDREGDRHECVRSGVNAHGPAHADRPPVHAAGGERRHGHVQGWLTERMQPCQSDEQVHTSDELHEPGHPDAPDASGQVYGAAASRQLEQLLRAVDQVASAQSEEPDGQRHEHRGRKADLLCEHDVHQIPLRPSSHWRHPIRRRGQGCTDMPITCTTGNSIVMRHVSLWSAPPQQTVVYRWALVRRLWPCPELHPIRRTDLARWRISYRSMR
jgi:hypothetical protein